MATEPLIPEAPPRLWRRRWRFLLAICALGVATVAGLIGWQMLRMHRAQAELQQVLAELDRDEPGWRTEAIEAARANVPDKENSVPTILRARRALPKFSNDEQDRLKAMLAELSPQVRLSDEQYHYCIDQLESMERAVSLVQQVARMPRGHCPIQSDPNGISADLVLINKAPLLQFWPTQLLVLIHAHEGDATAGLQMCAVNLHIAAAIGDEPYLVCQWYRGRHVNTALDGLERLLGHGEISQLDLEAFQAKLAVEAAHDPYSIAIRGERAMNHDALDALARGVLPLSIWRQQVQGESQPIGWRDRARDWVGDRLPAPVEAIEAQTWYLRRQTRLLRETTSAPWRERAAAAAAFDADEETVPAIARFKHYAQMLCTRLQSCRGRLSCAIAAVAAERYRLRHSRWPDSLAALVPEFLPAVAADPFDGQPLRYKRLLDGVVIYTVGPDLTDNGGNLAREIPAADGTDIGFRLWDVANRGQLPKTTGAP
jgi:hypothetical protein